MLYSKIYERFYSFRSKIAGITGEFFSFHANRIYLSLIVVLQAGSWWLSSYIYRSLSGDLLVLHYNVDFGIDWIGNRGTIFYFPILNLVFLLGSLIILAIFGPGKNFRAQSHYLLSGVVMANLGILVYLTLVYTINFR